MSFIRSLKVKNLEFILGGVFVVYLVLGMDMPEFIAIYVDTLIGKLALICWVVFMFLNTSPALAGLSLFVAIDLVRRASKATGFDALMQFSPSNKKRTAQMESYNTVPYTLEQEIISEIPTNPRGGGSLFDPEYSPSVLDAGYDVSVF
jgi:hypothetical protein